jgi:dolichol-phosphate mannosyltransferase
MNPFLVAGAAVDLLLLLILIATGTPAPQAQVLSYFAGACGYFLLNREAHRFVKVDGAAARITRTIEILITLIVGLALRGGIYVSMLHFTELPAPLLGFLPPLVAAATAHFGLQLLGERDDDGSVFPFTRRGLFWLPLILVSLRFFYLGLMELLPEEAYYWQYSTHLDYGYLDHPPMVSWLIALGETLVGHSAFSLRIFGFLCWLGSAWFVHRLSSEMAGERAAATTLVLFSMLPYFFLDGFFMSPDAPLLLCWCGLLYFLYRALIIEDRRAWIGVGVFTGLGMLSKYTISLVGAGAFLYLLTGRERRRWLVRFEPYLAALLALIIFSPVIYWNYVHEWASFTFQSSRRMNAEIRFSLHELLLNGVYLVTPVGVAATGLIWSGILKGRLPEGALVSDEARDRIRWFVLCCSIVPIGVFALYSLRHSPKINWIGPGFVVLMPLLGAWSIGTRLSSGQVELPRLARWWRPTAMVLLGFYSLLLQYPAIGLPMIGYPNLRRFVGWPSLAEESVSHADRMTREDGRPPVIVGMDKHLIASELAFYSRYFVSGAPYRVAGRNLFDQPALMYVWWSPPEQYAGQNLLMVGKWKKEVTDDIVGGYFDRLSPIEEIVTRANGQIVATHFVRRGYGFRPKSGGQKGAAEDSDD